MRKSRWSALLAILMGFALIAVACGNDSDGDDGSGDDAADTADAGDDDAEDTAGDTGGDAEDTGGDDAEDTSGDTGGDDSAAGGEVRGVTDDEVRIGLLAQLQFYPGIDTGAQARMQRENDNGGIGGRDLVLVNSIDDNSDSQVNLDSAKQLVEQDGIFALVTTSAVLFPATTDYLAEQQVPFSGWGFMPGFCDPGDWGFGFNGCLSGLALGVEGAKPNLSLSEPLEELTGDEEFSLVIFNSDDPAGEQGSAQYNIIWGDRILAEESVPVGGTVTDFAPYVNTVLENEPDVVIVSTDFATAIPMKAALLGSGYEGVVLDYVTYVPGLLQDAGTAGALEGGYSNTQFPAQEGGKEATAQIATDLESIGEEPFVTQGASIGYWAMDTLIQIMQAAEAAGGLSPTTFDQVANVDGLDIDSGLDGGLCPFNTLEAHTQPVPGAGLVKVENGEYTVAVEFGCWSLGEVPG